MTKHISRPDAGTVIDGIDHARVSCRKYTEHKIRQTAEHHAFQLNCKTNVIVKIEKPYIVTKRNE